MLERRGGVQRDERRERPGGERVDERHERSENSPSTGAMAGIVARPNRLTGIGTIAEETRSQPISGTAASSA